MSEFVVVDESCVCVEGLLVMLVSIKLAFRDVRFAFDSFSLRVIVKRRLF